LLSAAVGKPAVLVLASVLPRPRVESFLRAGGKGPSLVEMLRVNSTKKDIVVALEKELTELREEKTVLAQREAAILKALSAYTGGGVPVVRATREMNTVDMARTVIRNAA